MHRPILALLVAVLAYTPAGRSSDEPAGDAQRLKDEIRTHLHQEVNLNDEVTVLWKRQHLAGYFRFDTLHFRCLIFKQGDRWQETVDLLQQVLDAPVGPHRIHLVATPFYMEEVVDAGARPPEAASPVPEDGYEVVLVVSSVTRPSLKEQP
ncbi:MAG: hypothetical protein HY722_07925 [Planctomycetes bacterium]|nr:hypothetical protein [Planctomycetota bacterium]